MRELMTRHKISIVLFAVWLVGGTVLFLRIQEGKRLAQQVAALQQEIAALPPPAPDLKLRGMGEAFSWIDSMPDFLMDLTLWSKKRSIAIVSIEPGEAAYKAGYTEQPVKLLLQGRFLDVGTYLTFLEDLPRPMQVTGLQLTRSATEAPDLLAHLDLVVYIRDPR